MDGTVARGKMADVHCARHGVWGEPFLRKVLRLRCYVKCGLLVGVGSRVSSPWQLYRDLAWGSGYALGLWVRAVTESNLAFTIQYLEAERVDTIGLEEDGHAQTHLYAGAACREYTDWAFF